MVVNGEVNRFGLVHNDIKLIQNSLYRKGIELLQMREKRAVVPIVGKVLNVLFGTVSEVYIKVIKRKLKNIVKDQRILAQMTGENVSILNVTRIELAKNRASINWLINNQRELNLDVINSSGVMTTELQELSGFMQQYFQLITITNKVHLCSA